MDYRLFSADDHMDLHYLPPDLWTSRAPSAYKSRVPRIEETEQGSCWVVDGKIYKRAIMDPSATTSTTGKSAAAFPNVKGRWRASTAELRLADMDQDRVEGHVLYGDPFGLTLSPDLQLNTTILQLYNDWVADFTKASPNRLVGIGLLPVHDAAVCAQEVTRCAKIGLKGVQFSAFSAYKFPWDAAWEPVWAAAAQTHLPVSFHIGGGEWSCDVFAPHPKDRGVVATATAIHPSRVDEVLCELVFAGVTKRYPDFQAVLAESGIGWIPYLLERMDRKYEERHIRSHRDDAVDLDMKPSGYYSRQMHATFQEDPIGIKLINELGPHTAMWGSDYPHTDGVWPDSQSTVQGMFRGIDPKVTRMVTRDNVMKLFNQG